MELALLNRPAHRRRSLELHVSFVRLSGAVEDKVISQSFSILSIRTVSVVHESLLEQRCYAMQVTGPAQAPAASKR